MKEKPTETTAHHGASVRLSDSIAGFRFDLMIGELGERSLRIHGPSNDSARPVELIVPASQAYRFMEAVIHFVATMEKGEMHQVARGKRKATA